MARVEVRKGSAAARGEKRSEERGGEFVVCAELPGLRRDGVFEVALPVPKAQRRRRIEVQTGGTKQSGTDRAGQERGQA